MDHMDFYDKSSKDADAMPAPPKKEEPEVEESPPTLPPHADE